MMNNEAVTVAWKLSKRNSIMTLSNLLLVMVMYYVAMVTWVLYYLFLRPTAATADGADDGTAAAICTAIRCRALLEEKGFDLDDVNKRCDIRGFGPVTPMIYFCWKGNVAMCRYLIARGADCRKANRYGSFPLFWAARYGHLEIIKLLSHDGGARDDIQKQTGLGYSPLRIAFVADHFPVVQWLIRNGALAFRDGDGGIDDEIMRRDLSPTLIDGAPIEWDSDKREPVLAGAREAVTTHDNAVQLLFTRMIASSKQRASPLAIFDGTSGILKVIADYGVTGSPQQLRTLRQLTELLPAFINDTPFVEEDEEDEEEDEDEDEEDY